MSSNARRYFGCFLPMVLAIFGCGTMLLLGNAGRIVVELRPVPDDSMAPLLQPGWSVMLSNAAFWVQEPPVGDIVTVKTADGWALRRIVAAPGETIEVRGGRILVNGRPRDPGYTPIGRGPDQLPITLGADQYFLMADNRDAVDSRTWGPVARDRIFGRAIFKIGEGRTFLEVMITPTAALPLPPVGTPTPGTGGQLRRTAAPPTSTASVGAAAGATP